VGDGRVAGPSGVPDPELVAAAAMVFVPDTSLPELSPADSRHLIDVLRLREHETVVASDGGGSWVTCRLRAGEGGRRGRDRVASLVADGPVRHQPRPDPVITVAFAPTKADRPEWVTQKLTELGVDRIVPLRTTRSVVRWEGARGEKAVDRLRRVAREAAAQCRRTWLPEVTGVTTLAELSAAPDGPPCLAHPGGGQPSLIHPVVAVGPEGGWDDGELSAGNPLMGLGPTVLRAETAALAAGTVLCGLRSGLFA
jgi:16S rRNA (uracil1498-N3)-methyltransferase